MYRQSIFISKSQFHFTNGKSRANAYGSKINKLHTVLYILFFFFWYSVLSFSFSFLVEKKTLLSVTKKFIVEVMNLLQTH